MAIAKMKVKTATLKRKSSKKGVGVGFAKALTHFRTRVFSRHPTHRLLRVTLPLLPFRAVVRLGSTTVSRPGRIQCNTIEAIKNSADKLLMKKCFTAANALTAKWAHLTDKDGYNSLKFPIVVKNRWSSRGEGIYLFKTLEEFQKWAATHPNAANYIAEEFHDYSREYRLHVTKDGVFYTCRKMLKEETPKEKRWIRNDSTCNWIIESNPMFDKPSNWNSIVTECVKALKGVGLDFGACDVKVQSAKDSKGKVRPEPKFIVIEINSAPSFGDKTLSHYLIQIPKILKDKYVNG